jgi:hypothetical protein
MNRTILTTAALLAGAASLCSGQAFGWQSANRWGGSTSHSWGSTSHENAWGGSTSHTYGEGTEHTNPYGGSTSGAYGAGAVHTYPGGGATYHPPGAYPGYAGYPAYHPPVAVPYYSSGCSGCAAAAGAVVGAAVGVAAGAAAASANNSATYAQGYAAGSTAAYAMGANYAALPAGSAPVTSSGMTYYVDGSTWFQPTYGANGVYYRVVPAP